VDKPPSPQPERTAPDPLKSSSPKDARGSPGAGDAPTSPSHAALGRDPVGISLRPKTVESPRACPPSPQSYGLGVPVGISMVRARMCLSRRKHRGNLHGLQSPCGTIQNLSRPDSTSGGS
jgi:hypothetical protein